MNDIQRKYYNTFRKGDYVKNVGKRSKYYGKTGIIVDLDYYIKVKYDGEIALGRHPAGILVKTIPPSFNDDLFTI